MICTTCTVSSMYRGSVPAANTTVGAWWAKRASCPSSYPGTPSSAALMIESRASASR